jgi:hypothetical protein
LPLDGSLRNLLIYEGLLFILQEVPPTQRTGTNSERLTITRGDLISALEKYVEEEKIKSLNVSIVGKNDRSSVLRLLNSLGIKRKKEEKLTKYGDIIGVILENRRNIRISHRIELGATIKGKNLFIDYTNVISKRVDDKKRVADGRISFQLFKTERYKGLTSTEHPYTTKQLTTYMSPEATLIALLGLYSSFITTSDNIHYMLFFSPEEVGSILAGDKDVRTMFIIKEAAKSLLVDIIRKKYSEELVVVETLLNAKIQEAMGQQNVRSLSLILLKLARERQTYKIYQQLPLNFYKRESPEIWRLIAEVLSPSEAILSRLAENDNVEYNNLLSSINGFYRYVVLGDRWGLYLAIRELQHAYIKVRSDEKARNVAQRYLRLLKSLQYLATRL